MLSSSVRARVLRDELQLERSSEREIPAIGVRKPLFADDARQDARLDRARVRGVELARERRVVGIGVFASGAVLHQPRQRRQHVDRRIDAAPVEIA